MGELPMRREFRFARVFNFRDLGGHPGHDGRTVRWRRLFRSDNLAGLAEVDRASFQALGVRTVVDLRRAHEINSGGRVPAWDGLAYRNIDPNHPEWTETPYTDDLDPVRYLANRYQDLARHGAPQLAQALGVIADEGAGPVVVHCVAGKDRTGVLCALALALLGVSDDDIDADYTRSTAGSLRYVEWARANGQPDLVMAPWFYSHPGTMALFLAELRERYGSVERYATDAGLSSPQLAALRTHLLS